MTSLSIIIKHLFSIYSIKQHYTHTDQSANDSPASSTITTTGFPANLLFPRLFRLFPQKIKKRAKLLPDIPGLQRVVVKFSILLMDCHRRVIVHHQKIIHCQPAGAPVAIRKGMNIFKFCMKIRRSYESIFV